MNRTILVDTSAWICSFKKRGYERIKEVISQGLDNNIITTSGLIIFEILQGAKDVKEYERLKDYFSSLQYLSFPEFMWAKASNLSYNLLRKGITVPSTDLFIATVAIENNCLLLNNDRHFKIIEEHTTLKTFSL